MKKISASIVASAAVAMSVAAETPVGGGLAGDQVASVVTKSGSGFAVVWQDSKIDGKGWGIGLQRFNPGLASLGQVQRVNTQTFEHQEKPVTATFSDGGIVVVWQSGRRGQQDVMIRQMQSDGTWLRSESYANTFRLGDQFEPSVAVLGDNTFVVVWISRGQFGSASKALMGQRFSRNGTRLGSEFRIDEIRGGNAGLPQVVSSSGGGFAVLWTSDTTTGAVSRQLLRRSYSVDGVPVGSTEPIIGIPGDIRELSAASSVQGVDVLVRHPKSKKVALYSLNGSGSSLVREFDSSTVAEGVSVRADGTNVLCAWTTKRADGLGSVCYSIVIDRATPAIGSPARLSPSVSLSEISPSVLRVDANITVAVWSKMTGNNGFDVILNAQ